jgi:hypothetical protein
MMGPQGVANKVKQITEDTLLPISLVFALGGGVMWLTTIYNKTEAHAKALDQVVLKQDEYSRNLQEIMTKLGRIEERLSRGN